QHSIQDLMPTSGTLIYDTLTDIKQERGIAGMLGLVGLLLSASAIFSNLEQAFNNIWGAPEARNWWKHRLVAIGTTALVLLLLFASVGITSALTWLQNRHLPGLGIQAREVPLLWQVVGHVIPLALTILMFTLLDKTVRS